MVTNGYKWLQMVTNGYKKLNQANSNTASLFRLIVNPFKTTPPALFHFLISVAAEIQLLCPTLNFSVDLL